MACNYKTDTIELKKVMIEQGVDTITELAELSGVDRNTLSKILSGESQPSSNVMFKLVWALGMPSSKAGEIFFKPNLPNT